MNTDEKKWFAAKVKHNTEKKIKTRLDEILTENFVPFRDVVIERNGRKFRKSKPLIPSLIFVKTDSQTAMSLSAELNVTIKFLRNLDTKKLLVVPEKSMQDFMFLCDLSESAIQVENANLRQGDRVRVIKGDFAGIEGELVRIRGHKRVVVRLEGLFSLATTYIPSAFLEKI
ncbi:MAG: UpxY family transcription antiterminator [Prevotellaceae bacterium]|jgi:transcription antitermination factor NusG|nr:UpxY family transcription antiterminator [Prevotellaceae bacterium]